MVTVIFDRNGKFAFYMKANPDELDALWEMAEEEGYDMSTDYWPEYV